MVKKRRQGDKTKPKNIEEMNEIFEKKLRPLQSHNARHIFMVLRDAETQYLTTYDLQSILVEQGNKLNKVELNNWLSTLQEAEIVQKAPKRGKPTTKPYTRRYTFDLWKLTIKGREISYKLEVFGEKNSIQKTKKKIFENTMERKEEITKLPMLEDINFKDQEKLLDLSLNLVLLKILKEKQVVDLRSLSKQTGFTYDKIYEFIKNQEEISSSPLYLLDKSVIVLREKILKTIGLGQRINYMISLSPEGKKIISKLSP